MSPMPPILKVEVPKELNFLLPVMGEELLRVGNNRDGGYIIPKRITNVVSYLISCGINDDWTFEEELKTLNPEIIIHAYDHTVSSKIFRKNFLKQIRKFLKGKCQFKTIVEKYHVLKNYNNFFLESAKHYKERVFLPRLEKDDADFEKIFSRLEPAEEVLLKIDIEGGEYRIIDDIVRYQSRVNCIIIEFHDIGVFRATFIESVEKLKCFFDVVHFHVNNAGRLCMDGFPDALEITFSKKGFFPIKGYRKLLPIDGLDYPNIPSRTDYKISFNC